MPYLLHIHATRSHPSPSSRSRTLYTVLMIAVAACGLLWRSGFIPMPPTLSKYGGDALWALMLFLGLGFLIPRCPTWRVALLAIGCSWAVEFSQLYHAPWTDILRSTLPGRLVLGSTFNWPDLAAYALGPGLGACAELWFGTLPPRIWRRRQPGRRRSDS